MISTFKANLAAFNFVKMFRIAIIFNFTAALTIVLIVGCATLPEDFDRPKSYALKDTEHTHFGRDEAVHGIFLYMLRKIVS